MIKHIICIIVVSLFIGAALIQSCRKIDGVINVSSSSSSVKNFFSAPRKVHPVVRKVMDEIQRREMVSGFVNEFAKKNGYAIWDKAIISISNGNSGSNFMGGGEEIAFVYVPLVIENTTQTNGFVRAVINDSISLSYCLAQDYKNYPTESTTETTASEFSSLIMLLDNEVFNHHEFLITDKKLFYDSDTSSSIARKANLLSVAASNGFSNNLLAGSITSVCWLVEDPENCTCIPKNRPDCDWPGGCEACSNEVCIDIVLGTGSGSGGTKEPVGGGIPMNGGPNGGGQIPPYYPCNPDPVPLDGLEPESLPPCPPPPGGIGWTPTPNPCDSYILQLQLDSTFRAKFQSLNSTQTTGNPYEQGFTVNNRSTGTYTAISGTNYSPFIQWNISSPVDGLLHSHYYQLNNIFSPGDVLFMAKLYLGGYARDTSNFFFGMTSHNGLPYLLKVTNPAKFRIFAQKILAKELKNDAFTADYNPKLNSGENSKNEKAFLEMLRKEGAGTGLTLYRAQDDGVGNYNFDKWQKLSWDGFDVSTTNCY